VSRGIAVAASLIASPRVARESASSACPVATSRGRPRSEQTVLALLRRESGYGGRTRAAMPSSAAGRSGRACSRTPSTSLIPTGFSRGQAIRVGLTSTRIRHAAMPTRRGRL